MWPLLATVDECLGEPWLRPLAVHLGAGEATADPSRGGRRFSSVQHLADLFDRYALHRPQMLLAWARGEDSDGTGRALTLDGAWQAELWRRLRDRIPEPDLAQRTGAACARLRDEPGLARLPERLSLFGLTRFPAGQLAGPARARARARRAPVPAASRRPRCGRPSRGTTRPVVRRRADADRDARGQPPAGLLGAGLARAAARRLRRRRSTADHHHPVERAGGHAAVADPGGRDARIAHRPARRCPATTTAARCWPRTTAACRSTPATAARARSRWCATRSCTCSRRTRRSSRAT